MKILSILIISAVSCFAEKIYLNSGKSIDAKILDANSTHLTLQRDSDKQRFRLGVNMLTKDSRKQLELYHSENRYSSIPPSELPLDDSSVKRYASFIDKLIDDRLRSLKVVKTQSIDEHTYVRRLYLTLAGRIPTKDELTSFISDKDSDKKDKLIQKLLKSTSYVNHQINWWSDILRVKDRVNGTNINVGSIYRKWLKDSISSGKKYDEIVSQLISSSGKILDGGEAVSYYLRDRGMQEDNLAHTVRIFLGTRLECAMCHNHPFDKWTQRQFYEMTAFTSGIGGVKLRSEGKAIGDLSRSISKDGDDRSGLFNNWRNQVRDSIQFGIDNEGTGEIKLPKDFAGDDGKPGEKVTAKAIFTPRPDNHSKKSRITFAKWITSKDNPRFTTVIANRIWKQIFGAGPIEPIDSMMDDTVSSNPELMSYLEKLMVSVDYDLRQYQRVLLNTKLFQRKSKKNDYKSLEEYSFEGPLIRRMTGEQLWDSLVVLVYNNIDSKERIYLHNQQDYRPIYNKYKDMNGSEIYKDFKMLADQNPGERNFLRVLGEDVYFNEQKNKKFRDRHLVRSSYLQYPAPGGHLIRQFGGSDKEQIDNSNSEPNTTQVLNLLNGFVETNILNKKDADFIKQIQSEKSKSNQVESAFLSILARKPKSNESDILKKFIDEKDGFKHVSWILLNSHEFIFIK